MIRRSLCAAAAAVVFAGAAGADVANFDSFTEGDGGLTLTDGGITFSDLSRRIPGEPTATLTVEQANGTLSGQPGFTPNNALGFGGYSPGDGAAFTRFGSVDITPSEPSTSASLHFYDFGSNDPGTTIVLDAYRNGVLVDSQSVNAVTGFGLHHYEIALEGTEFDLLRLHIGPTEESVMFALIDTVEIEVGSSCPADFDNSGDLTLADFVAFRNAYVAGDLAADFDQSGTLTLADFVAFRNAYVAGCP